MANQKKGFLLRIDPDVYDALQKWADDEFRSVNAHIEYLLRDSLKRAGKLTKGKTMNDENNVSSEEP